MKENDPDVPGSLRYFIGEEEDLRAVVESARAIRKVIAQEPLAPVIEEEMDPGPHIQSDAEIGEWVKRVVTTMWHPVGTCASGGRCKAQGQSTASV
jgi:choline dehydrogenase